MAGETVKTPGKPDWFLGLNWLLANVVTVPLASAVAWATATSEVLFAAVSGPCIVGLAQWFVLRRTLRVKAWWVLVAVVSLPTFVLLLGLLYINFHVSPGEGYEASVTIALPANWALVGAGQFLLLRRRVRWAGWWVPVTLLAAYAGARAIVASYGSYWPPLHYFGLGDSFGQTVLGYLAWAMAYGLISGAALVLLATRAKESRRASRRMTLVLALATVIAVPIGVITSRLGSGATTLVAVMLIVMGVGWAILSGAALKERWQSLGPARGLRIVSACVLLLLALAGLIGLGFTVSVLAGAALVGLGAWELWARLWARHRADPAKRRLLVASTVVALLILAALGWLRLLRPMNPQHLLLQHRMGKRRFPRVDLRGANLSGANLSEAWLGSADLTEADLNGANLSGANLVGADLSRADLTEADLSGANLYHADLSGRSLTLADLTGANLTIADLTAADLTEADLSGARLYEAKVREANLTLANLTESDLTKADLSRADLRGARLCEAKVSEAYLTLVDLTGADLTEADLTEVHLNGANLTKSDLFKADLTGADLSGANLTGAQLLNADLTGVDLTGANLKGAKVTGEQLAQAASLEGATMPDGSVHE